MLRRLSIHGLVTVAFLAGVAIVSLNLIVQLLFDEADERDALLAWDDVLSKPGGYDCGCEELHSPEPAPHAGE